LIACWEIARTLLHCCLGNCSLDCHNTSAPSILLYRPQLRTILAAPVHSNPCGRTRSTIQYTDDIVWSSCSLHLFVSLDLTSLSHDSAVRHVSYVGWASSSVLPPSRRPTSGRPPPPIYSRTQPRHVRPPSFKATSFGVQSKQRCGYLSQ